MRAAQVQKIIVILFGSAASLLPLRGLATGNSVGGGGGAILCRGPGGSYSARLVDLVEAEFWDKLKPARELQALPWQRQFALALDRVSFFDPDFRRLLKAGNVSPGGLPRYLEKTRDTKMIFPAPQDLSTGRAPPLEPDCQLVGAAIYSEEETLQISHFIWKLLSARDRAALLLHEAVYLAHRKIFQELGRKERPNSAPARRIVGLAFSSAFDGRPEVGKELKRFSGAGDFRPYAVRISGYDGYEERPDRELRAQLDRLFQNVLPHIVQGSARPVYLSKAACRQGYEILVEDDDSAHRDPGRKCELAYLSHSAVLDPYGVRAQKEELESLRPFSVTNRIIKRNFDSDDIRNMADRELRSYRYHFDASPVFYDGGDGEHGIGEQRGRLILKCHSPKSKSGYVAGLKLLCGSETVAEVETISPRGGDGEQGALFWEAAVLPIFNKAFY